MPFLPATPAKRRHEVRIVPYLHLLAHPQGESLIVWRD